jgi:hypothetical protein
VFSLAGNYLIYKIFANGCGGIGGKVYFSVWGGLRYIGLLPPLYTRCSIADARQANRARANISKRAFIATKLPNE